MLLTDEVPEPPSFTDSKPDAESAGKSSIGGKSEISSDDGSDFFVISSKFEGLKAGAAAGSFSLEGFAAGLATEATAEAAAGESELLDSLFLSDNASTPNDFLLFSTENFGENSSSGSASSSTVIFTTEPLVPEGAESNSDEELLEVRKIEKTTDTPTATSAKTHAKIKARKRMRPILTPQTSPIIKDRQNPTTAAMVIYLGFIIPLPPSFFQIKIKKTFGQVLNTVNTSSIVFHKDGKR